MKRLPLPTTKLSKVSRGESWLSSQTRPRGAAAGSPGRAAGGAVTAGAEGSSGYDEILRVHEQKNVPGNFHVEPLLQTVAEWNMRRQLEK